jgi:arylsulfatase
MGGVMSKRLNVLLITGDHTRHDAVSCNLNERESSCLARIVRTPNIDRLAREGVTFTNSYTTNPICVPARATITTGNYSHRCTGVKRNSGRIRDDQVKLAEHFASCGYATYACGKLHYVPYAPPTQPRLVHGFQSVDLCESGRIIAQFDPLGRMHGLEDFHDYLKSVGWGGYARAHGIGNNDVRPAVSPLPAEHHEEAWVADRTIARLREHAARRDGRPFLMWTSFAKPHSPYDPPRPWDAMYDPRQVPGPLGDWEDDTLLDGRDIELKLRRKVYGWDKLSAEAVQVARAFYCGMMSFQDAMVGRILHYLDEAGLADSTIVIYTADHGDLLGDFGRFFKVCMFDGSVKIPFIWRAPGIIPADGPRVRDQLVGLHDILPTLAALTGCPLPRRVDGSDITPILRDAKAEGRSCFISQTADSPHQKYMVRTPRWKYVYCELGPTEELYDMTRENCEMHNLAGESGLRSVMTELRETLIRWCIENGDEAMVKDGKLAVSSAEGLAEPTFSAGVMGWRKY